MNRRECFEKLMRKEEGAPVLLDIGGTPMTGFESPSQIAELARLLGIEAGVDILNPIQPGAYQMEPERLKSSFGERLCFWGGIDEQQLLTFGSPEEVEEETSHILDLMGKNGGFVAAPSHNIQGDVPPENIIAFCRQVKERRRLF